MAQERRWDSEVKFHAFWWMNVEIKTSIRPHRISVMSLGFERICPSEIVSPRSDYEMYKNIVKTVNALIRQCLRKWQRQSDLSGSSVLSSDVNEKRAVQPGRQGMPQVSRASPSREITSKVGKARVGYEDTWSLQKGEPLKRTPVSISREFYRAWSHDAEVALFQTQIREGLGHTGFSEAQSLGVWEQTAQNQWEDACSFEDFWRGLVPTSCVELKTKPGASCSGLQSSDIRDMILSSTNVPGCIQSFPGRHVVHQPQVGYI